MVSMTMSKNAQHNPIDKIKAVMAHQPVFPIPRGELWLGTAFLKHAGFKDTLENHLHVADLLGHDMVCLPIADAPSEKPDLGYRFFQVADLKNAVNCSERFIAAVVDGPFQALVNQVGLMDVLTHWIRDQRKIVSAYQANALQCLDLIARCLTQGIHAVVITDDLASEQGPLMHPREIQALSAPFYARAVDEIHRAGAYAFLHSCGKIARMATVFKSWHIDGLAAIQHDPNNIIDLCKTLGSRMICLAGIDAEMLGPEPVAQSALSAFQSIIKYAASNGGLILGSACGLYQGSHFERIQTLYEIADRRA